MPYKILGTGQTIDTIKAELFALLQTDGWSISGEEATKGTLAIKTSGNTMYINGTSSAYLPQGGIMPTSSSNTILLTCKDNGLSISDGINILIAENTQKVGIYDGSGNLVYESLYSRLCYSTGDIGDQGTDPDKYITQGSAYNIYTSATLPARFSLSTPMYPISLRWDGMLLCTSRNVFHTNMTGLCKPYDIKTYNSEDYIVSLNMKFLARV